MALVEAAVDAWRSTAGLVDATVLGALERLGYDRSYERLAPPPALEAGSLVADGPDAERLEDAGPAPGCGAIAIDRRAGTVALPAGVGVDPGGLGKGRIADEVAAAVRAAGATGACIDLGGDVVVAGTADDGDVWQIDVEDPLDADRSIASLTVEQGAVATSSILRRRWDHDGRSVHHLVDPRTGVPVQSDVVAATVVAAEAMWAEVLAKAAVIAGLAEGVALLAASGASGLLVTDDGLAVRTAGFADFEAHEAVAAGGGR
jgi:thiamine biosynthesis lipoprotein